MKSVASVIALVAVMTLSVLPAKASIINWTLSGVTFDDGGTMSGTFSTDSTTGAVTAFDITTTLGSTLAGFVYDSSTSFIYANNLYSPNSFLAIENGFSTYINLAFSNPLTTPGVDLLVPGDLASLNLLDGSWECNNCANVRDVVSGEAISATPLPAALPLFATGLGGLGLLGWRRKRKVQVAC